MSNFLYTFSLSLVINHMLIYFTDFLKIEVLIGGKSISTPLVICLCFLLLNTRKRINNNSVIDLSDG
jgi:hypothetical protein